MSSRGLPGYQQIDRGEWVWWIDSARWRPEWEDVIGGSLGEIRNVIRRSRHASTAVLTLPSAGDDLSAYLKLYHPPRWTDRLKELFRLSRAERFLRMTVRLAADGFGVPRVLVAGERLRAGLVTGGFLVTAAIDALPLHEVPAALARSAAPERMRVKRALLRAIGAEVAHFHALGYLHGDLVLTNIMVCWMPQEKVWLLDHDRSRHAWPILRAQRQVRNLVQLNRLRIEAVTNTDRLRLLRSYARSLGWTDERFRREARQIARKTLDARRKATLPPAALL